MNWAQEQIVRAAYLVFDQMMRNSTTEKQKVKCQDLYYAIQKYKAESRRLSDVQGKIN